MEGTLLIMLQNCHRHVSGFFYDMIVHKCLFSSFGGKISYDNTMGLSRLEAGTSFIQDDTDDLEEQPLVRHQSRRVSSGSVESSKEVEVIEDLEVSPPSSPRQLNRGNHSQHNGDAFPSAEVFSSH